MNKLYRSLNKLHWHKCACDTDTPVFTDYAIALILLSSEWRKTSSSLTNTHKIEQWSWNIFACNWCTISTNWWCNYIHSSSARGWSTKWENCSCCPFSFETCQYRDYSYFKKLFRWLFLSAQIDSPLCIPKFISLTFRYISFFQENSKVVGDKKCKKGKRNDACGTLCLVIHLNYYRQSATRPRRWRMQSVWLCSMSVPQTANIRIAHHKIPKQWKLFNIYMEL